jgi:hypothetical protein
VDFTRYLPPGVYVDAGSTPTISPVGVVPTVVCLIGQGVGYHTFTETVSFASGNSVVLTKKGINPSSLAVTGYVADPNVSGQSVPHTFLPDIPGSPGTPRDYSTTQDVSAGVTNSVTTLVRTTSGQISMTYPQVSVTYQYTDPDYYALHNFTDFTSFQAAYGPALNPTSGAIVSPLSLAAQIALMNGANQIYAIALDGTGTLQQQFADAYTLLSASNNNVNMVVPLWDTITDGTAIAGMFQTLNAALTADANSGVLRTAIVGLDSAYAGSATAVATLATGISSSRIVLSWPNQVSFFNGYTNTTQIVDGIYLAAALAGQAASRQPQVPLTRKLPQGFTGLPAAVQSALTRTVKDQLAVAGVCVVEADRNGRLSVRQGLTTNYAGGVLTRELSLVRAQDALYTLVQNNLEGAALIGQPVTSSTPLQVKSIVAGALETAKTAELIVDYSNLAVRQQTPPNGDPTVINVQFAYKPSYPLNYVVVGFTVDTSTGNSTLTSGSSITTGQ